MQAGGDSASGRLAIVAGGGLLPHYLADAARRNGEDPLIIQLIDEPAPNGPDSTWNTRRSVTLRA